MKNLHVVATDKPSRLSILNSGKLNFGAEIMSSYNSKPQHIYITSDEKPEEGDWFYNPIINKIQINCNSDSCEKIILTTDQDLIADGVQSVDDEFLEWFVNNPSCEEVEVKLENYYASGALQPNLWQYKVIIPKDEPKPTIKQVDYVAKKQERMYSEEDLRKAFNCAREFNSLDGVVDVHIVLPMGGDMSDLQPLHFTFEEWLKQFKKK